MRFSPYIWAIALIVFNRKTTWDHFNAFEIWKDDEKLMERNDVDSESCQFSVASRVGQKFSKGK